MVNFIELVDIPVKVDVRIVAATHQDLEKLVNEGRFREDLYHRLNVIRIHIPKLAHRSEDIPMLAQHFLARAGKELGVSPKIYVPKQQTICNNCHGQVTCVSLKIPAVG